MKNNTSDLKKILAFTHTLYGLKTLLRFKGLPYWEDAHWDRWDSVAEHCWRMAMLALTLHPYLQLKTDILKTLEIILIHDIVELTASDYSPIGKHGVGGGHAFDHQAFQNKYVREMAAAKTIFKSLPPKMSRKYIFLFQDYMNTKVDPKKATPEGKFAYALDKIEATVQIIDWRKLKKDWPREHFTKSIKYLFEWSDYDPALKAFCRLLKSEGLKILKPMKTS